MDGLLHRKVNLIITTGGNINTGQVVLVVFRKVIGESPLQMICKAWIEDTYFKVILFSDDNVMVADTVRDMDLYYTIFIDQKHLM